MDCIYIIFFVILGMVLGSFYNVVGLRMPKGESIVNPPSHCPKCDHRLTFFELIPVLSFIFQGGKCKKCKSKISWVYPAFEFSCGVIFGISYIVFGLSLELLIVLTFLSMLMIIMISDVEYMIIPDEILLFFGIVLALEIGIIFGYKELFISLFNGLIAFGIMFLLKKLGDFLFKKESMGGGDIKLMFVFGLVLGWKTSILSIFIGSLVGLPVSLLLMKKNSEHIIPFGPFLSIGAIILLLTRIDFNFIASILLR